MTRRTRPQEPIEEPEAPQPDEAAQLEAQLSAQLDALAAERDQAEAIAEEAILALQRERADFMNFRRRTADERAAERGLAGVDLITKVLNLADDFDRAIENRPANLDGDAWAEGIAAIDRKLRLLLESEGVTQLDAAPGSPFDPREHEAVVIVPGSGRAEGEIVEELRRGYRLRDRVIRPALVAVATAEVPAADAPPGGDADSSAPDALIN
jgi:molecular chaperone GrpE